PPSLGHGADRDGPARPHRPVQCRRCVGPTSVATVCSNSSGDRLSVKQPAKRSISPTTRSVAANSRPPASEVILPPSNAPTTRRPSSVQIRLHSVGIGTPLTLRQTVEPTRFSQNGAPMHLPL